MRLSPYTLRNHIGEILARLGVTSRAEAVALAVQAGMGVGSPIPSLL